MRYTPNGRPVTQFNVAVNQSTKNQQTGEWVEETDWFRVSVWGDRAERAAENLRKGNKVFVEGRFKTREFEGRDGRGGRRSRSPPTASSTWRSGTREDGEGQFAAPAAAGGRRPAAPAARRGGPPRRRQRWRHGRHRARRPAVLTPDRPTTDAPPAERPPAPEETTTCRPARSKKRDDYYRDRRRRKVCAFCADKTVQIDYKEVNRLRRYLSERAKIEPRRKTGTCAAHQRELAVALKRARIVALLPYAPQHLRP